MRIFLVELLVITVIVLAVMALVFRDRRATHLLHRIRDGALLYVLLIFALGMFTYFRQTF